MITIGVFGTAECHKYSKPLQEMIGAHNTKVAFGKFTHVDQVKAMIRKLHLEALIITDDTLLRGILDWIPDFKCPQNKNGSDANLSQNDYHGSFMKMEGAWIGVEWDVDVLILNPLRHLFTVPEAKYIFKRHISKITRPQDWLPQPTFNWELVDENTSDVRFADLLRDVDESVLCAVDIETEKDCPLRIINCSGYYYLRADGTTHGIVIPTRTMLGVHRMRELNATRVAKVMQGGTYDAVYFLRYACPLNNWMYDTSNLFHSWYAELPKRLDYITAFACRYVRYWKDDAATGGDYEYYKYNARDGWATLNTCISLLHEMPDWAKNNYLQEFPINFPCIHMELDGLRADEAELQRQRKIVEDRADASLAKLRRWIHPDFNPRSPVQCKKLLWVLGYRNRDGEVDSSDEMTMKLASAEHPLTELICNEILEYRGLAKLRDTYLVPEKLWHSRLFYRLNANGTDTGRLSSSESSFWCGLQIQNIPNEAAWAVRSWVVADPGWLFGGGDYAQSEARCVGYLSGCKTLIDLVESENDYHAWNASAFFGVPYEQIYDNLMGTTLNKPLRQLSKRVNHGSNYNMTKYMLYLTMGPKEVAKARGLLKLPASMSSLDVCEHLLASYVRRYPEVKIDWYNDIKRKVSLTKKLTSPLGWVRHFFDDVTKNKNAFNGAVAHGGQNLSVAIINRVMMILFRDMLYGRLRGNFRMKAQIHDEIFFAYRENAEWVPDYVKEKMKYPVQVTDIKGVTRTMLIPPDMNAGERVWVKLK